MNKTIDIGQYVETAINWLTENGKPLFDVIKYIGNSSIMGIEWTLVNTPFYVIILLFTLLAWWKAGKGIAIMTVGGLTLIFLMGLWIETMETLALIFVSTITALVISVPLGIWAAKSKLAAKIIRPLLDLMQTMPAFVYLIPAVLFSVSVKYPVPLQLLFLRCHPQYD